MPYSQKINRTGYKILRIAGQFFALFTIALGLLGAAAWVLNNPALGKFLSISSQMKFNAALCFILLGSALFFSGMKKRTSRNIALVVAAAGFLISVVTCVEYFFNWNSGIDEFFFIDHNMLGTTNPGRMAWRSTLDFVMLFAGIFLINRETARGYRPANFLALAALLFPTQALVGYALGRMSILGLDPASGYMAVPTAAAFIFAAFSILLYVPDRGIMGILTGRSQSSAVFRRLLAAAIILPPILGGIAINIAGAAKYPAEYSTATVVWSSMIFFVALIWFNAAQANETEKNLRQIQQRLEIALQSSGAATWGWNVFENKWDEWDTRFRELYGIDVQAPNTFEFLLSHIHPEDRQRITARIEQMAATPGDDVWNEEFRILHPKRGERWIGGLGRCMRDTEGKMLRLTGVNFDVTDRKLADLERHRFVSLAENSPEFVAMSDLDQNPFFVNEAGLKLVGLDSLAQAKKVKVQDFFFPEDQKNISETFLPQVLKEGHGSMEVRFRHFKTGKAIWMLYNIAVLTDPAGQPIGYSTVSRNITQRRRDEEILKKTAEDLKRSNQELEQFAYVSSHDLQEPLRTIATYADLLLLREKGKLGEDSAKFLDYIRDGATHAQELVQALLNYAGLGHNTFSYFEPTDLNKLAMQAIMNLDSAIKESNARVTCGNLPTLKVNALQMTQLLQNLISNAIKYRSTVPEIQVFSRLEKERWVFAVKDNGIGVAPQYQERIFMIFKRLHSRQEYPGTGIGLALCKKIVEQHGGDIWMESEPGKGSTFYFSLPLVLSVEKEKNVKASQYSAH